MNCLLCNKSKSECKCEGGFKIIYHYGVVKSDKEMKAFLKKSKMEQSLELTNFMSKRNDEINNKLAEDLNTISENQIKIAYKLLNAKVNKNGTK